MNHNSPGDNRKENQDQKDGLGKKARLQDHAQDVEFERIGQEKYRYEPVHSIMSLNFSFIFYSFQSAQSSTNKACQVTKG